MVVIDPYLGMSEESATENSENKSLGFSISESGSNDTRFTLCACHLALLEVAEPYAQLK